MQVSLHIGAILNLPIGIFAKFMAERKAQEALRVKQNTNKREQMYAHIHITGINS
jgi:hypothetical protein